MYGFTSYQDESDDGVLTLMDGSNTSIFEPKEKCKVLQEVFFDGKHIEKENYDDVFKEKIEHEYEGLKTKDNLADEEKDSFLNRPPDIRETEAAIQSLKANKASGPDEIYTNLLKEGGDELVKAIHNLFHKSWQKGSVPVDLKITAVKFLKKPGKKNYHQASSYQPISLASSMGKCQEGLLSPD